MISSFLLTIYPSKSIVQNTESEYWNGLVTDSYNLLESNDGETNKNLGDYYSVLASTRKRVYNIFKTYSLFN